MLLDGDVPLVVSSDDVTPPSTKSIGKNVKKVFLQDDKNGSIDFNSEPKKLSSGKGGGLNSKGNGKDGCDNYFCSKVKRSTFV
eukprot:10887224-Ditylum_brightwellii.AAC.1